MSIYIYNNIINQVLLRWHLAYRFVTVVVVVVVLSVKSKIVIPKMYLIY